MTTHTAQLTKIQIQGLALAIRIEELALDASGGVRQALIEEANYLFNLHGGRGLSMTAHFANSFVKSVK